MPTTRAAPRSRGETGFGARPTEPGERRRGAAAKSVRRGGASARVGGPVDRSRLDRRIEASVDRRRSVLTGPYANRVLDGTDRHAAVGDMVRAHAVDDGERDGHRVLVGGHDLELELRGQLQLVRGATVVAPARGRIAARSHLGHRQTLHAPGDQRVMHGIEHVRHDDRFDLLHPALLRGMAAPCSATRSQEPCHALSRTPAASVVGKCARRWPRSIASGRVASAAVGAPRRAYCNPPRAGSCILQCLAPTSSLPPCGRRGQCRLSFGQGSGAPRAAARRCWVVTARVRAMHAALLLLRLGAPEDPAPLVGHRSPPPGVPLTPPDRRRSLVALAMMLAVILGGGARGLAADEPKPDPTGIATGDRSLVYDAGGAAFAVSEPAATPPPPYRA